jgi:hypothetical protein
MADRDKNAKYRTEIQQVRMTFCYSARHHRPSCARKRAVTFFLSSFASNSIITIYALLVAYALSPVCALKSAQGVLLSLILF